MVVDVVGIRDQVSNLFTDIDLVVVGGGRWVAGGGRWQAVAGGGMVVSGGGGDGSGGDGT